MGKFIGSYDHSKWKQEVINHLYRFITHNEIEAAIKSPTKEKSST
jgi:hypothetical protein